jgi:hypothetical protein
VRLLMPTLPVSPAAIEVRCGVELAPVSGDDWAA